MAEHQHPGVHIEEIERGPRQIEGVSTNTAAMLGETERGSITPRLVASYTEYARWYGQTFAAAKFLPGAVRAFFENGGHLAVIGRLVGEGVATSEAAFGDFVVRAAGPGAWGSRVFAKIGPSTATNADGSSIGFRIRLAYWTGPAPATDPFSLEGAAPPPTLVEDFDNLVTDETSANYYGKRINFVDLDKGDANQGPELSVLATLVRNAGVSPSTAPAHGATLLSGGSDGIAELDVDDYRGKPAGGRTTAQGLTALEDDRYRDVSLVYAPAISTDIAKAIVSHCETMRFRFALIDSEPGRSRASDLDPRGAIADTKYAAFYYPWLVTLDPRSGAQALVPPGGSILGVFARLDSERGVFKAPANEIVRGAVGLEHSIDDRLQDELNPKGVNVLRTFPGRGIVVWGARTMSSDGLWKYISVRRLFIFLERSIYEGTQWVVFEPNDDRLWARVSDTIRLFLRSQWRLGALQGRTEDDAFFIKCDRTTMTQDDILNGRLICEIGVAPVKPAEFVILRIFQQAAHPDP